MSVIGIDIGKSQHVAAVCRSGAQEAERGVLRLGSGRGGFEQLDAWMGRHGEVELVVMESSGHYWMPLASHLRARGQAVAVVNPLRAKYFAKSRLQRSKSDPADARMLAVLGMSTRPVAREPLAGSGLREASRFVMTLVREQAQVCQRLGRLIDLAFPELGEAFEDPSCASALAVLRVAPTAAAVRRKRASTLAQAKAPAGRRSLGAKKAAELKRLAEHSVAPPELEEQMAFQIPILIGQYDLLESQIQAAEARLASMLDDEVARRLLSIPGVGPATAATLMAEIGDIWRFSDVDQLLAYAGVHPKEASSGQKGSNPETSWHMAKTGNAHLRTAVYRMALVGTQHNPVISAHYRRKRQAGKSKMNALGHCMSKSLSLVWGVWRNGQPFDPEYRA
ncbi:MAG: IS110 family transposase [Candidatus Dormiibacterota bacterium]